MEKDRDASLEKVLRSVAEKKSLIDALLLFPFLIIAVFSYTPCLVLVMAGVTAAVHMSLWFSQVMSILYSYGMVFYDLSCRTRQHCTSAKGL